jgi:hypothetical protein
MDKQKFIKWLEEEAIKAAAEDVKSSRSAGINSAGYNFDAGWLEALEYVRNHVEVQTVIVKTNILPTEPGYYFAKWMVNNIGLGESILSKMRVVLVFHETPSGQLRAAMCGFSDCKSLEDFVWYGKVTMPVEI